MGHALRPGEATETSRTLGGPLDRLWSAALAARVPQASWSLREGDTVLAAHETERFYSSASMIKTFLVAYALGLAEAGSLDLDAPATVRADRRAAGDGVLGTWALPIDLPLGELLRLTIVVSDNTATNAVLDAVGGPEPFNAALAADGYASRLLRAVNGAGPAWSGAAGFAGPDEIITPVGLGMTSLAEHERLLDEVRSGARLPRLGTALLDLLAEQQDRRMLARWVGEDVWFAHKTGTDGRVRHDSGVLRSRGRELVVSCFTDGGPAQEWVDHPACVGAGLALAWSLAALGIDAHPPPGLPEPP